MNEFHYDELTSLKVGKFILSNLIENYITTETVETLNRINPNWIQLVRTGRSFENLENISSLNCIHLEVEFTSDWDYVALTFLKFSMLLLGADSTKRLQKSI